MNETEEKPVETEAEPTVTMLPVHWWKKPPGTSRSSWEIACLAATLRGWDPQQESGSEVTAAEYEVGIADARGFIGLIASGGGAPGSASVLRGPDGAIVGARIKKIGDSTAMQRLFILAHHNAMHAVVCAKPSPIEVLSLISDQQADSATSMVKLQGLMDSCWDHCLWPAPASPEMTWLINNEPGWYANSYPGLYANSYGMNEANVRGK